MSGLGTLHQDIEYVDIRRAHPQDQPEPTTFYTKWVDQSSAKHAAPELIAADALRRRYPGHSLIFSEDHRLANLFALPGVKVHPLDPEGELQLVNVTFQPQPGGTGGKASGSLVDDVIVGSLKLSWNESEFVVYSTKFQVNNFIRTVRFIIHDGPEQPARDLVLATCLYTEQLHDEIWMFDRGFWSKSKGLWLDIKDSSWDDVIMKEESKQALQMDIYDFFKAESTYKKLSIPWKRGLIMYGPPGNGKTISIKAIMKTCTESGFTPLYVKSFQAPQGEEGAMQSIFSQARQTAPCVLILEDLDSLINDRNRSFFLNQLDGLEGNNGMLVIATTNHFDKLDPGLSNRPSRFDRRYLFDDPDYPARVLYAKYWQEKLKDNDEIIFPDPLSREVADMTDGFSFAYLKEAFVSALVRITSADVDERIPFSVVLKSQILSLRKELGKQTLGTLGPSKPVDGPTARIICAYPGPPKPEAFQTVPGKQAFQKQVLHAPPSAYPQVNLMPGSLPSSITSPDLMKSPTSTTRRHPRPVPSTSTSGAGSSQRNPFSIGIDNTPLMKVSDGTDVHTTKESSDWDA